MIRVWWGEVVDRLPADEYLKWKLGPWSAAIDVGYFGAWAFPAGCLCLTLGIALWLVRRK